jgi:hypothetical protein
MIQFLTRAKAILRGESLPPNDVAVLSILGCLAVTPAILYFASDHVGNAGEILAVLSLAPCGVTAGRIGSAWNRDRRLRSYWS